MHIHGYTFGQVASGAVSADELGRLCDSVLFGDDDRAALRRAGELLDDQIDALLDVWYGFVGSQPHLLKQFSTPAGAPIGDYLDKVGAASGSGSATPVPPTMATTGWRTSTRSVVGTPAPRRTPQTGPTPRHTCRCATSSRSSCRSP